MRCMVFRPSQCLRGTAYLSSKWLTRDEGVSFLIAGESPARPGAASSTDLSGKASTFSAPLFDVGLVRDSHYQSDTVLGELSSIETKPGQVTSGTSNGISDYTSATDPTGTHTMY